MFSMVVIIVALLAIHIIRNGFNIDQPIPMPTRYGEFNYYHGLLLIICLFMITLPDGIKGIYRAAMRAAGLQKQPEHLLVRCVAMDFFFAAVLVGFSDNL